VQRVGELGARPVLRGRRIDGVNVRSLQRRRGIARACPGFNEGPLAPQICKLSFGAVTGEDDGPQIGVVGTDLVEFATQVAEFAQMPGTQIIQILAHAGEHRADAIRMDEHAAGVSHS